ncbi:hypothetical protein D9M68_930410 [compost metagenome]
MNKARTRRLTARLRAGKDRKAEFKDATEVSVRMVGYFESKRSEFAAWLESDRDAQYVGPLAGRKRSAKKEAVITRS